jgi:hypothetical protein
MGALYSFAAMLTRVYRRLPPSAQHALERKMVGALKDNVGLAPIVFELRTAAHFMRAGFEVDFHDLCGSGRYDFLVRRADIEMEVECKSVSGDLGRKVHLFRQYQLGRELFRLMRSGAKQGTVRLAVATVPDRLFGEHKFMQDVARAVGAALDSAASVAEAAPCTVDYYEFPIESSPFDCPSPPQIGEEDVVAYCSRVMGYSVGPLLMVFAPKHNATIVAIRSSKPDEFLMGVYRKSEGGSQKTTVENKSPVFSAFSSAI